MKTAAIIPDRALILLDLDHNKRAWNVLFIMALLATRPDIGPTVERLVPVGRVFQGKGRTAAKETRCR